LRPANGVAVRLSHLAQCGSWYQTVAADAQAVSPPLLNSKPYHQL